MILEDMKVDNLQLAAQKLIDTYTNNLGCELRAEFVQFAKFVGVFKDEEYKSKSKHFNIFEMLHKKDKVNTFPNIE